MKRIIVILFCVLANVIIGFAQEPLIKHYSEDFFAIYYVDKNGNYHGPRAVYRDGNLVYLTYYKKGRIIEEMVFESGRIMFFIHKVRNKPCSIYFEIDNKDVVLDTRAVFESYYSNGLLDEKETIVFSDNEYLCDMCSFPIGKALSFNDKGELVEKRVYSKTVNEYGVSNIIRSKKYKENNSTEVFRFGRIHESNLLDEMGYKTGYWLEQVDGLEVGCYYKEGKRDGVYIEYKNNKVSLDGRYRKGKRIGRWYYFGNKGEVKTVKKM